MEDKRLPFYAVGDIEASDWIDFVVLGFYDGSEYKTFRQIEKFIDYIDRKKYNRIKIYFHNGGKYDFLFFLEPLYKRSYKVSLLENAGRVITIDVYTNNIHFTLIDSYSLLPQSLERLSESFNVEFKKIKFDFKTERVSVDNKKLMDHLENDCKGLYDILGIYFRYEYVCSHKITIASQALDTFRRKFLSFDLVKTRVEYEKVFRENFYSGGRVEVFKGYGKNINVYDVNSLYPFVMCEKMPVGECQKVRTFKKNKIGFYSIDLLKSPEFYISPFLVRLPYKNFFVNGKGTYYLSSHTLNYLISEFGIKFSVNYGYVFSGSEYLFNDYVKYFFDIKNNAGDDSATRVIAKLFLNALYGKFGQRSDHFRIENYNGQTKFMSFNDSPISEKFGLVLVPEKSKSKFILPYIAAYITELARLHHFKLMMEKPESMFYCDTDSLFTSRRYDTGSNIGDLSFKGQGECVFLSNKSYAIRSGGETEIKLKGFTVKDFTFRKFLSILKHSGELRETRTKILSYRECFTRRKGIIKESGIFLKLVNMEKSTFGLYDKRRLKKSKRYIFNSTPYSFDEVQSFKNKKKD